MPGYSLRQKQAGTGVVSDRVGGHRSLARFCLIRLCECRGWESGRCRPAAVMLVIGVDVAERGTQPDGVGEPRIPASPGSAERQIASMASAHDHPQHQTNPSLARDQRLRHPPATPRAARRSCSHRPFTPGEQPCSPPWPYEPIAAKAWTIMTFPGSDNRPGSQGRAGPDCKMPCHRQAPVHACAWRSLCRLARLGAYS